jgi:hypothetical protein
LTVLLNWPEAAKAGQYVVVQCHPTYSGGTAYFNAQTGGAHASHLKFFNSCSDASKGMGVYEEGATTAHGSWGALNWWAPQGTVFNRVEFQNRRTAGSGWSTWIQSDNQFVSLHPADNTWDGRQTTLAEFTSFSVLASCSDKDGCPHNNAHNHVRRLWFTVNDPNPPGLVAGGELLEGGVRRGTELLTLWLSDLAPGLESASVSVNDRLVHSFDWRPACNLHLGVPLRLVPCATNRSVDLALSTENSPWVTGSNTLSICVRDFALASRCIERVVTVDNTCPGSGGTQASKLTGGVQVGNEADNVLPRAVVRSHVTPFVRGRVETSAGTPVGGATVCVFETVDLPDAGPELVATPRSAANGNFVTALDPGPSRRLMFVYRYNNQIQADSAVLGSIVVPTLRVADKTLSNGDNARFRGTVPGPNAGNRAVVLQARVGRKWRTFKQVRTNPDGSYTGLYRFTQTRGLVRYVFRARVKRQGGYPYLPGGSKKRRVLVRG